MLARDLVEQVPTISRSASGAEAARLVAEYRLSGLVVADGGTPHVVVPGSQILGLLLPGYLRVEPGLAHALDEESADELCERLNDVTLGQLLDRGLITAVTPARVSLDHTIIEIASVMVEGRHPLVLVVDDAGTYCGAVMTSRVLAAAALLAGQDSILMRRRLQRDVSQRGEPWIPEQHLDSPEASPSPSPRPSASSDQGSTP